MCSSVSFGPMDFSKNEVYAADSNYFQKQAKRCKFQWGEEIFFSDLVATVTMEEIQAELILNWDQTGIKMVPSSTKTMEKQCAKHVEMTGVNDKGKRRTVFCGSLVGEFLPVQVILKGKIHAATQGFLSYQIGTLHTHQTTGPHKRQCCSIKRYIVPLN